MSKPRFGVLDVETCKDLDGIYKIYALSFVTLLGKEN
jgi:hypothetical protein